jgi:hypothetical protein
MAKITKNGVRLPKYWKKNSVALLVVLSPKKMNDFYTPCDACRSPERSSKEKDENMLAYAYSRNFGPSSQRWILVPTSDKML